MTTTRPADADILEAGPRKRWNGTEDTEDREVDRATVGEKPPKDGSPRTEPARNKAGRQKWKKASRGCENPRTKLSWGGTPSVAMNVAQVRFKRVSLRLH